MTSWDGWTSDGAYGLRIEPPALSEIDRMCREAGRVETGGILVGRYSPDLTVAIVLEATPPPSDSRRAHSWFNRGVVGLREMLANKWRAIHRTHYVGEWHFHPTQVVVPSACDFSQMVQIAHADEYKCREPVMVIFGANERDGARSLRAFVCPAGISAMELQARKKRGKPQSTYAHPTRQERGREG